jgi:hypothetical protein
MLIDAPVVREYLERAFASNFIEISDVYRDLNWGGGYVHAQDLLDSEFAPIARAALNDIRGQVGEQIPLSQIPNEKFSHAIELKTYLEAFAGLLRPKLEALQACHEKYEERAAHQSRFSEHVPEPIGRAIVLIHKYISAIDTAVTMGEFKDIRNESADDELTNILVKFNKVVRALNTPRRHTGAVRRLGFEVKDEYDVQDFLAALLHTQFDDVRKEEPMASFGVSKSRCDLFIATHGIFIEIKTTLKKSEKEIFDDFTMDIPPYLSSGKCKKLILFVHDPEQKILNQRRFNDLTHLQHRGASIDIEVVFAT